MKKLNNKGFSLVEIIAAIAILAILMTVATTAYNAYKKKARQQAYDTMAKSVTQAATNYLMENAKSKYITFDTLKELDYVDTLQDPRYKENECNGIVIQKVVQGENQKQLDQLFQKVKLCCKNYKYQYDYTGEEVKVTEIESCEYVDGDEIDGMYKLIYKPLGGSGCDPTIVMKRQNEKWGTLCETSREKFVFKGWNTKKNGSGATITEDTIVGDKDINAYAIWNEIFTLKYEEEGGSICNPKSISKENGEKWGTLCEPQKSGYAFKNWTTKKNGEGTKITKNTYAEKDLTVYAHWNPYYTLTYNSNGGTTCNPGSITEEKGEKWGTLCEPTRNNYAFVEWNTNKDGTGTKITEKSIVENNTTVYAIWNPKYTITYNSNGGTDCNPKTLVQEKGKKWGTLCAPTRTGYKFNGWKDQNNKNVTADTICSGSLTLTAQWTSKPYTLTYHNNGGSGCITKNGNYDSAWGTLCIPTRTGYTFSKWTNSNGTQVTSSTVCKGNLDVTAQWTINEYTLTFDSNGGTTCNPQKITKKYNNEWGTLCTPTRSGYTFSGWYNGSTKVTNTSKATANITVKASWNANTYTLTYNNNGGSGCSKKEGKFGSKWGTLCTPTKSGYSFTKWVDSNNNEVTADRVINGDLTVKAVWSAKAYTLTYDSNNGTTCNPKTKTGNYGSTWGDLCTPTRTGYTFAGWKNGNTTITKNSTVSSSITVIAQWTTNSYTLTYNSNGGTTCNPITKTGSYGSTWGDLCTPTKTGYTFVGWKDSSGNVVTKNSTVPAYNVNVTAAWTSNSYTLTYNNNGGSGCSTQTGYYGSTWGSLCTPTRTGYTFGGWYDSSGNYISSTTVCYGSKSVTASWSANSSATSNSKSYSGTTSSTTMTFSTYNADTSRGVIASASSGSVSCYYSGSDIICNVSNISSSTASTSSDCQAIANSVGETREVKYFTNSYYDYSKWNDAPAGCYIRVNNSPKTSETWTCMKSGAQNSFFTGSESHCPKKYCGYSNCLTRGYGGSGSSKYCKCWIPLSTSKIYESTVYITYYVYN